MQQFHRANIQILHYVLPKLNIGNMFSWFLFVCWCLMLPLRIPAAETDSRTDTQGDKDTLQIILWNKSLLKHWKVHIFHSFCSSIYRFFFAFSAAFCIAWYHLRRKAYPTPNPIPMASHDNKLQSIHFLQKQIGSGWNLAKEATKRNGTGVETK